MVKVIGSVTRYPARFSVLSYMGVILLGAVLLAQPFAVTEGQTPLSITDSMFMATSALCVTGLAVRDTGGDFSFFGQAVILLLIQLGGIGIVTVTTFFTFHLGHGGLRDRAAVTETLGADDKMDLPRMLRWVLLLTFLFEAAGFLVLLIRNLFVQSPGEACWHALFHSVSAYCNAGFALHGDSFVGYQGDWLVNLTLAALIVIGGLGFPVMLDLGRCWRQDGWVFWRRLHLHSKMMLLGTAVLIPAGMTAFLVLEADGVFKEMSWPQSLLAAFFSSVTCRTAGFNTLDMASLTNASRFVIILLMIVGAGPCSTGGGMKVSTFLVLVLRGWANCFGYSKVTLARRTIPQSVIERATTTALLFGAIAIVAITTLLMVEQSDQPHAQLKGVFLETMFEAVSALGTVGLSLGVTGDFSTAGRWILIVLMFLGRLGPISVALALSRRERKTKIEFPEAEPLIG